jgi:hypothetical protein
MNSKYRLRFLSQRIVADRSFRIVDRPRSDDLAQQFIAAIEHSVAANQAGVESAVSIERLKCTTTKYSGHKVAWKKKRGGGELALGNLLFCPEQSSIRAHGGEDWTSLRG